jgi:hypothetical protein
MNGRLTSCQTSKFAGEGRLLWYHRDAEKGA